MPILGHFTAKFTVWKWQEKETAVRVSVICPNLVKIQYKNRRKLSENSHVHKMSVSWWILIKFGKEAG